MLQPLEPITDLSKSPYVSFSADELPESVAEQIHDMPDVEDRETWRFYKRKNPSYTFSSYVTQPDVISYPQSNDDWFYFATPYYEPEKSYGIREYMEVHGFEWQLNDGQSLQSFHRNLPKGYGLYTGRHFGLGLFGYEQLNLVNKFVIVPNFNSSAADKPLIPLDPIPFGGAGKLISGHLCSQEAEDRFRTYTGGLIETFDLPFADGGAWLPPVWRNRRLVGLLARWQPYDLEKSVIEWKKKFGRFFINRVNLPVLREDIPEDVSIMVPMHKNRGLLARAPAIKWFNAHNNLSGFRSFGAALSKLTWKSRIRQKQIWRD